MMDEVLAKARTIIRLTEESPDLRPIVRSFFDAATSSVSHVVQCPVTRIAAIIDPVMGYDPVGGRLFSAPADRIADYVRSENLAIDWLLETHVHADHLTAADHLREVLGGRTAIGGRVGEVLAHFVPLYPDRALPSQDEPIFDRLLADGDMIRIGNIAGIAIAVPGHTPADMAFVFGDAVFVGDTLMMPDFGTARADFPGGDAARLYESIARLLALPGEARMFLCHDYAPPGRSEACWETTVDAQRDGNLHVGQGISRDTFVERREGRDRQLALPRLIVEAVQVNLRAGALPPPDERGVRALSIPINRF